MEEESEIESPEWHLHILEKRKRKLETGEAELISLEKLRGGSQVMKVRAVVVWK